MSGGAGPRPSGRILGLLRVRNEADLLADTLDHMAGFCDGGVWVYDDASEDGSADLCERHPAVREVLRGEVWDRDRERAEHQNRQAVLEAARRAAGPDDWFVYLDADERVEFDWEELRRYPPDVLAVRMKLFDFYITAEDVARPYTERRRIGPEYRNVLIAFRNRPGMAYRHPDQREVELGSPGRVAYAGWVRHYGKALSVERWERKCDYYAESFPKYAEKWAARRGKAVHDRSDFGKPLVDWADRKREGFPMALRPGVESDASRGGPLRVLMTNHQLVHPSGSETFTLTLARHLRARGHEVTVYSKFLGPMAREFEEAGVAVCGDLQQVRLGEYDVAHVHHNVCAYEVRYHFPELPMVFVSHGVLPFLEAPPAVDLGVARYLAVSEEVRDRLLADGIASDKVSVFRNVVDEERFTPGPPLPDRPRRAVVLSNKIDSGTEGVIREACRAAGIDVLFLGNRFAAVDASDLPAVLRDAHLVFTLGRGAMEAMLCGRVPFVLDYQGGDGMVTPDNLLDLLACNLSGRRHRRSYTPERVLRELDGWRPELGTALRERALREFGAAVRVPALEGLYREVLAPRARPRIEPGVERVLFHFVGAVGETRAWADHLSGRSCATPARADRCARLACVLLEAGWLESAREMLADQIANDPDHLDSLALLARVGIEDGSLADALELVKHVLAACPGHPIATEAFRTLRARLHQAGVRS